MVGATFWNAVSFLSLTSVSLAAPSYAPTTDSQTSICTTSNSKCIPFTVELTWDLANPTNGVARNVILTNGTFPGPPLKMKVGECVDFTVINNMKNATGIHFHGIEQKDTPWADGVPGLSQEPIKPGQSYMYQWTATEQGVYFYHAHYKGQMMDGLYGAIIISAKEGSDKPFAKIDSSAVEALEKAESKLEPIFASDWTQFTFDEFYAIQAAANIDNTCADAIILNGMGSVYCLSPAELKANQAPQVPKLLNNGSLTAKGCIPPSTAATQGNYTRNLATLPAAAYDQCTPSSGKNYTLKVDPADKYAALTVMNPGGFAWLKLTIDNHKMIVYEMNGHYIVPQTVNQISIGNGDRISFFVKLDQQPEDYTIRVANNGLNQALSGYGVLSYVGSSGPATNAQPLMSYGGQNKTAIIPFVAGKAAPYPAVSVSKTADSTFKFNLVKTPKQAKAFSWTFSGVSSYDMSRDDLAPLLYQDINTVQTSDTIIKTKSNSWVDLIVQVQGPLAQPHPIHKHGNKFFVLGSGKGSFTWDSIASAASAGIPFNFDTPPYVDGVTTLPSENSSTWTALRYHVTNPGAWFLHCHMQTHFSGGMAVALLDGFESLSKIPSDVGKFCPGSGLSDIDWTGSSSGNATSGTGSDGSAGKKSSTATYSNVASVKQGTNMVLVALISACVFALSL